MATWIGQNVRLNIINPDLDELPTEWERRVWMCWSVDARVFFASELKKTPTSLVGCFSSMCYSFLTLWFRWNWPADNAAMFLFCANRMQTNLFRLNGAW